MVGKIPLCSKECRGNFDNDLYLVELHNYSSVHHTERCHLNLEAQVQLISCPDII